MRLALLLCGILLTAGCNQRSASAPAGSSEKENAAADDAIKALGRLEAAVEVGVSYQQYTQLLIEVKPATNEAERTLGEGVLRTHIAEAMQAYEDAGAIWKDKIEWPRRPTVPAPIAKKYNLEIEDSQGGMRTVWTVASAKLAEARRLRH